MSATLILIDMQKAANDPILGERGQLGAEANAARLLEAWRERGDPVVHIRHDDMDPASPYAPGEPGHAFNPIVAPLPHEMVVEKRTTNGFVGTDLMQVLEGFGHSQLVVCGVHLEFCVSTTARMAGNLGFMVFLAGDATASIAKRDASGRLWSAEDVHALSLAILDGSFVKVSDTDTLLALADAPLH